MPLAAFTYAVLVSRAQDLVTRGRARRRAEHQPREAHFYTAATCLTVHKVEAAYVVLQRRISLPKNFWGSSFWRPLQLRKARYWR